MSLTIKQIEDSLRHTGGFVSQTAKNLNVTASAIYDRIKRSERLQQVKLEVDEQYLDIAEMKLIKKIQKEDLGAICFYLKCKGKKRGYVEKQEVVNEFGNNSEQPINIYIELTDASKQND